MELVRSVMLTIVLQLTKNLARFHNVMQDKVSKKMQHAKTALHSKKLVSLDYNVSNLNVRKGKKSEKMPHVKNAHHSKQSSVKTITIVTEPNAVNLNVDLEKSLPLMVNVKDVNLSQLLMKEAKYACHQLVEIDKRSNPMDLVKSVMKIPLYHQTGNLVSFQTVNPTSTLRTMGHVLDASHTLQLQKTD